MQRSTSPLLPRLRCFDGINARPTEAVVKYDEVLWVSAVVSFVGLIVALGVRDGMRKRLCRDVDPLLRESSAGADWIATYDSGWWSSTRFARRVRVIRRNLSLLPPALQQRYSRLRFAQGVLTLC